MKAFLRLLVKLGFGFRAHNVGSLQTPGPVLLLPNHVSWLDWLFLFVVLDDDWRFVTSSTTAGTSWFHKKLHLSEIRAAVRAKGLSNLCAPREVKVVRAIPKLGTGKINHRELEKLL